jgi:hypothetical protein
MSANGVISAISTLRLLLLVFPRVDGSAKAPAGWEFSSEASGRTLELGGYAAAPCDANPVRENTNLRSGSDMDIGEDPPHEPRGNRPPGTREEADTEPNAD